jgi:molybdenum cofactor cytidylyltransferase
MARLGEECASRNLPLLIEADGSRQRPLKAPGDREPVIPMFSNQVVVVAGLAGLGKPLTGQFVHRPEIFSSLSGLEPGESITLDAMARLLAHPAGGQKNIPLSARRILLLNQADSPDLQAQGMQLASRLLPAFHSVIISSLINSRIHAVCEPVAGIILAAGGSSRYGQPKQLLDWHGKPFVRVVAEAALSAGLARLVVVTGSHAEQVERALEGLPLLLVRNRDWRSGQGSSIQAGLRTLNQPPVPGGSLETPSIQASGEEMGAVLFLLADQPQVTPGIMRTLVEHHARTLAPIIAPLVAGQRANPVLFDRSTFPELMTLQGDVGGREIFKRIQVEPLPWDDAGLLADVDTPEDYRDLDNGQ